MTNHCEFNTNLECGCDHKCRVKVDVPLMKPSTKGLYAIMFFGVMVSLFVFGAMKMENHYRAQDLRMQENGR